MPNIKVFFNHKIMNIDFDAKFLSVKNEMAQESRVFFDFCIGADGSYSVVRRQMMRVVRCVPWSSFLQDSLVHLEYSHR